MANVIVVRNVYSPEAVAKALRAPSGNIARDLMRRGYKVETAAKRLCPVDHGKLRSSIHHHLVMIGGVPVCEVGTIVKYAKWVINGTGIYGPHNHRIVPVSAKALKFTPRKMAGGAFIPSKKRSVVIVKSVAGMKGRDFLRPALLAARS